MTTIHAEAADVEGFPLAQVIAQVKKELAAAQSVPGQGAGLALQTVTLAFSLSRVVDAEGKATIGIPLLGAELGGAGGVKSETVSSLLVKLAPPRPIVTMSGEELQELGLTQAILEVRRQLQEGLDDEPKLAPSQVELEIKFALTRKGGPKGEAKFLVFSIGGGATWSAAAVNAVKLTFAKPAAP
jgi:hypothetical protein